MSYIPPKLPRGFFAEKKSAVLPTYGRVPLPPPPPPPQVYMQQHVQGTQSAQQQWQPTEADISEFVRKSGIANGNGLKIEDLEAAWQGKYPNVAAHLFFPNGAPRFLLSLDIWKPLMRAYFAWFSIPRDKCTVIWGDIVNCIIRAEQEMQIPTEFTSWAYGCLCRFYLEDRKQQAYDPDKPEM